MHLKWENVPWDARAVLSAGTYVPGTKPTTLREAVQLFLEMPEPVRALTSLMCAEPIGGRQFLLDQEILELSRMLTH
jgi:hypothetical protein